MKRIVFLMPSIFLVSLVSLLAQSPVEKIDSLMRTYFHNGVFNGVVLVAERGHIVYKKAFGYADREWNIRNTADTKFRIASISKPFTALLVLQLVEAGKIDLNGTISQYIPDYKGKLGDSITIHQLLTHTSGILTSLEPAKEDVEERLYHELREMVKYAESADLYFKPGTGFRYSNLAYNILAYIVEQVAGKRFSDILREKIFEPAGMFNTRQGEYAHIEKYLAKGYEYKLLRGYENASFFDDSYTVGSGGLMSTLGDLYLFDRALYSGLLISGHFRAKIFTPASNGNYGYGWFINKRKMLSCTDSIIIADHSGSINGFGSYMARIITDSSLVIVLKNQRSDTYIDPAFAPEIGNQITSILYGGKVSYPGKSIARYVGFLIGTKGIDSAIAEYYRVIKDNSSSYSLAESELNRLGIELFFKFKMTDEALRIFEVNMLQFPKSYNTYDSYAFILMQNGDYKNSIFFYKKGLEVLKKYPEENDLMAVKKDSEQALVYIREMEEKNKGK